MGGGVVKFQRPAPLPGAVSHARETTPGIKRPGHTWSHRSMTNMPNFGKKNGRVKTENRTEEIEIKHDEWTNQTAGLWKVVMVVIAREREKIRGARAREDWEWRAAKGGGEGDGDERKSGRGKSREKRGGGEGGLVQSNKRTHTPLSQSRIHSTPDFPNEMRHLHTQTILGLDITGLNTAIFFNVHWKHPILFTPRCLRTATLQVNESNTMYDRFS